MENDLIDEESKINSSQKVPLRIGWFAVISIDQIL